MNERTPEECFRNAIDTLTKDFNEAFRAEIKDKPTEQIEEDEELCLDEVVYDNLNEHMLKILSVETLDVELADVLVRLQSIKSDLLKNS